MRENVLALAQHVEGAQKAEEVIARQLAKCGATADTFAATHLEADKLLISGALAIQYLAVLAQRLEESAPRR